MFALGDGSEVTPAIRSRHSSQGGRRSGGHHPITTETMQNDSRSPPVLKKELYEVPLLVSRKFRDVKFKTLVGISPVCDAAWYCVDDQLCVWPFGKSTDQVTLIQCDGVVTCVDIGVPSPFCKSFSSSKFMAVVCTENSVSLIGLDSDLKQIVSDNYFLQLPNATLFNQAQVSATGRVFMLSDCSMPNTLVEVKYKQSAGWFKSKCYFYYHSLLVGGGTGTGLLSSIFSKLVGGQQKNAPYVANGNGGSRRIFIRAESSFKFFASIDAVNLNLHEFLSAPTAKEMSLGSWRHNMDYDTDSDIRCIGRIAIADLVASSSSFRSVVDVFVTIGIDSNEPSVHVVTETGDLVTLRVDKVAGDLIISRSSSIASSVTAELNSAKRQKTPWGGIAALPALGNYAARTDVTREVTQSVSCALYAQIGGVDICAIGKTGSTKISVSKGDCMNFDVDVGGTVQRIVVQGRVGVDQYGSLVVPVLSGDSVNSPGSHQMPTIFVLTGKGVTVLEPAKISPSAAQLHVPETVGDVVGILSGPAESVFQYKAMCVRAVSDDVSVNSLQAEQDYASREGCVKPLSGGVWIGGMKKLAESALLSFHGQPVLVHRRRQEPVKGFAGLISGGNSSDSSSSSTVVVAFAEPVLISVTLQLKNLVKFIRVVLGSCKHRTTDLNSSSIAHTGSGRRMFIHGTSTTRADFARQQALISLEKLANELSEIDQVIALLSLIAKYPDCVASYQGPLLPSVDLIDLVKYNSELTRLCERLIKVVPGHELRETIESLRSNCPLILCSISPTIMGMFSPESIASIIHCAIANKAPVHLLLESVRALGRNNAHIEKSLSEVGLILRSLLQPDGLRGSDAVIEALLDGLQERLNDEHVLTCVLSWCGTSLDERLNRVVFEYIFARGYQDKMHLVTGNCFLENFLAKHADSGRKYTEVYAKYLMRIGKQALAGDVLEKQALSPGAGDLDDRVAMLELAQQMNPTSKRFELVSIARYVQVPLRDRLVEEHRREEYRALDSLILSISELFNLATELVYPDIQLTCYLFVTVPEKDVLKTWVDVLCRDFSFFAKLGSGSIEKGLMVFMKNLYRVSEEVRSKTIWKRIEVIVAIVEYIHCQLVLSGRAALKSWVVYELLESDMGLSLNQIVEIYSKIVREMNIWLSKIPHSNEFSSDAIPSKEYLESYLADRVVQGIQNALHDRRVVHEKKVLSILILLRNHIKVPNSGLEELIEDLSSGTSNEYRASLPTAEGL